MTVRGVDPARLWQRPEPLVAISKVLPAMIVPPRQSVLGDQGGGLCRPLDMPATEVRGADL